MYNEDLYKKFLRLDLTQSELDNFCANSGEHNQQDSFEKFYSLDIILNAIKKRRNNKIDNDYLVSWAVAYNSIIMESEYKKNDDCDCSLTDWIKHFISDLLDSLSFYDDFTKKYCGLKTFENEFKYYDKIYSYSLNTRTELVEWVIDEDDGECDCISIVVIHDTKEYTILQFLEEYNINEDNEYAEEVLQKYYAKIKELKTNGYKELKK